VANGEYISKWEHEHELKNVTRENLGYPIPPESVDIIVNGQRYKVI
jgi:hypothetical protein